MTRSLVNLIESRIQIANAVMAEELACSLYPLRPWRIPRFDYVQRGGIGERLACSWREARWRVRHAWEVLARGHCDGGE